MEDAPWTPQGDERQCGVACALFPPSHPRQKSPSKWVLLFRSDASCQSVTSSFHVIFSCTCPEHQLEKRCEYRIAAHPYSRVPELTWAVASCPGWCQRGTIAVHYDASSGMEAGGLHPSTVLLPNPVPHEARTSPARQPNLETKRLPQEAFPRLHLPLPQ